LTGQKARDRAKSVNADDGNRSFLINLLMVNFINNGYSCDLTGAGSWSSLVNRFETVEKSWYQWQIIGV
jgi:hypothetical protein